MGKLATELVSKKGIKVEELIEKLNKAYSDEWLAYIQYWTGAKIAEGMASGFVAGELKEHAAEELEHASKLAKRILQLGGSIIIDPKEWYKHSTCGYAIPSNPHVEALLKQNIEGERCAIAVYNALAEYVKDKDPITYNLILEILEDEVEHEQDLEDIQRDFLSVKCVK